MQPHPAVVASHHHKDEFLYCRVTLPPGVSKQYSDNDLILISKDNPESDDMRRNLHALGFIEGHEGEQSVKVKLYLTDNSQQGNPAGLAR